MGIGGKKKEKVKKMRKAKLITALSLTVVMLAAMTGLAAANPATVIIAKDVFSIGGGAIDSSTVTVSDIAYASFGDHTRYLTVTTSNPNVEARVYDGTHDTDWSNDDDPATTTHSFTYSAESPNTYTYTIEVRGTADGPVIVTDNAGTGYSYLAVEDAASASRQAFIPEFATIAIPVAAILGLLFFFNHRKRKKE